MVRATVGEVKKLFGGTLPPNWTTEDNVTNLCAQVDAELDALTYPDTISTTSAAALQLANEIVYRRMIHANWAHAGATTEEPRIWTRDLITRLTRLSKDATFKGFAASPMQEET